MCFMMRWCWIWGIWKHALLLFCCAPRPFAFQVRCASSSSTRLCSTSVSMTTDHTRWQIRNSLTLSSSPCPTTVTWVGSALPAEDERAGRSGVTPGLRLHLSMLDKWANTSGGQPLPCWRFFFEMNVGGRMWENVKRGTLWPAIPMIPLFSKSGMALL